MLMEVKRNIYISFLTIKYNIMRDMTNVFSFLVSLLFVIINNAIFVIQWLVLFGINSDIGGYDFENIMLIWAFSCSSNGIVALFFGGAGNLAGLILTGKLDSFIVQPRNLYLNIATSKTDITAIGDIIYSLILVLIFTPGIKNIFFYVIFSILGAIIMLSFEMIAGSVGFWIKNGKVVSSLLRNIMMIVSTYPDGIFNSVVKFLLYTIFPMGYIVYVPVRFMEDNSVIFFLCCAAATVIWLVLSVYIFKKGLKKYSSSNLMIAKF